MKRDDAKSMDFDSWHVEDVFVTSKGAKICRITNGGAACIWKPAPAMSAPFGPSSFDKDANARRQNLDVVLADETVHKQVTAIDEWAVDYIALHSDRLLKRPMSQEQVKLAYNSCVKEANDPRWPPMLKCKIDREGRNALCLWDDKDAAIPYPSNWRQIEMKVVIRVSHIWIMGAAFGLVLQITDAQLFEKESDRVGPRENPFRELV